MVLVHLGAPDVAAFESVLPVGEKAETDGDEVLVNLQDIYT